MTVPEAVELFKNQMENEIAHLSVGEELEDALFDALNDAEQVVIETHKAKGK